nr:Carbohydrate kinase, YjeF related protein [uncultured bacterium]
MTDNVLLSVDEMYRADAAAIAGGVPGLALMEAAGAGIADEIRRRWQPRRTVVLCGPGNNGGDGFVVARLLSEAGWPVRLALLGSPEKLRGDAAVNAARWEGDVLSLGPGVLSDGDLVVDGLFGAGLARDIDGPALATIKAIDARGLDCVGIDVPSGVHGDFGRILGAAPRCAVTVTFFRPKPGHFLLPGREFCGELKVVDIGIPRSVLAEIAPTARLNGPGLWQERFPWPGPASNKFTRGHAVVVGGAEMTGAARLAARGARRAGVGLLTIASPPGSFAIYASDAPGLLVKEIDSDEAFRTFLEDPRRNAVLAGPGNGVNGTTRGRVLATLAAGKACVLDADALTVFARDPGTLFAAIASSCVSGCGQGPRCILTPHEGEFARLFEGGGGGDKLARTRAAAALSGAVVLLKGADTVIAAPDGRAAINADAPFDLATGGSGDVLAGMGVGLLAQGMEPFDAACAAAWLHGQAAAEFGPGLIAEDLPDSLPAVLRRLRNSRERD